MDSGLFLNEKCEKAIRQIAQGDLQALSSLYDCVGKFMFSTAFAILNDYQMAEDAMQETFLKIAEQAKTYSSGTNAKGWIIAICRYTALNMLRKRGFEAPASDVLNETRADSTVQAFEQNLELLETLSQLSEQERQLVVLKVFWKMRYAEIAQVLELTPANARQKYKRATEKLRTMY